MRAAAGPSCGYPDSALADSFWYVIGYSQYELGQSDDALKTCRKVAEMTRKDPRTGQTVPAENKWQAVYITGQIFHSLGKPAQALAEYERVKDKFPDAREAIDFFVHRRLALPEVVTLRPNEAAEDHADVSQHSASRFESVPRRPAQVRFTPTEPGENHGHQPRGDPTRTTSSRLSWEMAKITATAKRRCLCR